MLSPGRLVWEKGHQDVIRAVAALRAGLVPGAPEVRLLCRRRARGREAAPLRRRARARATSSRSAAAFPTTRCPTSTRAPSCMVLASLAAQGLGGAVRHGAGRGARGGRADRRARRAARSRRSSATRRASFAPGDWLGIARGIAEIVARPPHASVRDPERVAALLVRRRRPSASQRVPRPARAHDAAAPLGGRRALAGTAARTRSRASARSRRSTGPVST